MNIKSIKKRLYSVFCIMLVFSVISLSGCTGNDQSADSSKESILFESGSDLGSGKTAFKLTTDDYSGNEYFFTINTDKATVGEALYELDFIQGEKGPYGLFIKTVNGITADYEKDGAYWAFYIDGEYASKSADQTEINPQSEYSLKIERP